MGLRELKEVAHEQFVRGKFAQCAQTYGQVLRLAPKDPNMRVRHAEACRRAGDRLQAIASYRAAAELLLELGCESRARGALKAALELDPKDPLLLADIAALAPQGVLSDLERASLDFCESDGLPALPPLEATVGFATPSHRNPRTPAPASAERRPALPPLHRALPMAPLTPPPPVLLAVHEPLPPGPLAQSRFSAEDVTPTVTSSPLELPVQPEPTPPEALRPPGIQPLVPVPSPGPAPRAPRPAMEVRRLSPTTLAFRLSPQDSWVLVRARTPLDMHMVADLETFRPDSHEFTLDITVDSQDEDASHAAP
ncbi:hypothetical protein SAMN05444354_103271 [Stigmatella aurantiaca]|uniref:Tetratricopeptide repeat domain protein n=1 Tax=Stigmatella aurantiaca TaxID=41 RepID=A0A1H7LL40_STIAU|nr:hypothetical protein [Stigmatella aurantiaca]SEK99664.1 hypothetical protein SAMN05444354_103271 [Stigmatella aurantiaca]